MTLTAGPVTVAVPGDLHLTTRDQSNFQHALAVVEEINRLVRPDFVQFIGDNVQDGLPEQFELFQELSAKLQAPYFALVGDHDICADHEATQFRKYVGEPYGSCSIKGLRFVRLNSLEVGRLGFSSTQLDWLATELEQARFENERVLLFQHHYPYKVCEDFSGPGIDRWRILIETYRPTAVICGHTHYGQIANNGQNLAITTRSIGDPEGGAAGYLLIHLEHDDLSLCYRTIEDFGPIVLITHPRDSLLATDGRHVVAAQTEVRVRVWSDEIITSVVGSVDEGDSFEMCSPSASQGVWTSPLDAMNLSKGEHLLRVRAISAHGGSGEHHVHFIVDRTGRYTGIPRVRPDVQTTAYC